MDDGKFQPLKGRVMQQFFDEKTDVRPEMLPAVRAIRNAGIETIASDSDLGRIGKATHGSYIQIQLIYEGGQEIANKVNLFARTLTDELQKESGNSGLALKLVSAERWEEDNTTTSMQITQLPIYRLQLVGYTKDEEIRLAWNKVAEKFTSSVIQ